MTKPKLFTALLLLLLADGLFAERDSLCMRVVDEFYFPDTTMMSPLRLIIHEDHIYSLSNSELNVLSIDDSGAISLDTTLLERDVYGADVYLSDMILLDSLLLVGTSKQLIVLNVSEASMPDSVTNYDFFMPDYSVYEGWEMHIHDTILYNFTSQHRSSVKRYNISDPMEMTEIFTYGDETRFVGGNHCFDHPYSYTFAPEDYDEGRVAIYRYHLDDTDTLSIDTLYNYEIDWSHTTIGGIVQDDSLFFMSYWDLSGSQIVSYSIGSDFDTLKILDNIEEAYDTYPSKGVLLSDSILYVGWDINLRAYNVINPSNIRKIGWYAIDTSITYSYTDIVQAGEYIVASFYQGIRVFKYPCLECYGNCELEQPIQDYKLDVYPNPLDDMCIIDISSPYNNTPSKELSIWDITGREIYRVIVPVNQTSFHWSTGDLARGVYLVRAQIADASVSKKVILI